MSDRSHSTNSQCKFTLIRWKEYTMAQPSAQCQELLAKKKICKTRTYPKDKKGKDWTLTSQTSKIDVFLPALIKSWYGPDWVRRVSLLQLKLMLGSACGNSDSTLGLTLLERSSCNLALLQVDSFRNGTGASKRLWESASYSHLQGILNLRRTCNQGHKGPLTDRMTPTRALEGVAEFGIPKNPFNAHLFQVRFLLTVLILHQESPQMT